MKKRLKCLFAVFAAACLLMSGCANTVHKEVINLPNEVPKVGPYSQMIRSNGFVFFSAQAAYDPETDKLVEGGITEQTDRIMKNISDGLTAAGLTFADVVEATIYIADMDMFEEMNLAYAQYFSEPYPARACVEVSELPVDGALLTIQVTAADKK